MKRLEISREYVSLFGNRDTASSLHTERNLGEKISSNEINK